MGERPKYGPGVEDPSGQTCVKWLTATLLDGPTIGVSDDTDRSSRVDQVWNAVVAVTALIAVFVSFITIRLQRRSDRDQTFLRLHEILLGDEMRLGRGLLIEVDKTGTLPDIDTKEYRQMLHAIAGMDTAGVYIKQGLMSRDRFMVVWHHNLRAIRTGARLMAIQRTEVLGGWWPWAHLWTLFDAADAFHDDKMICCQHEGRWPRPATRLDPVQQQSTATNGTRPDREQPQQTV